MLWLFSFTTNTLIMEIVIDIYPTKYLILCKYLWILKTCFQLNETFGKHCRTFSFFNSHIVTIFWYNMILSFLFNYTFLFQMWHIVFLAVFPCIISAGVKPLESLEDGSLWRERIADALLSDDDDFSSENSQIFRHRYPYQIVENTGKIYFNRAWPYKFDTFHSVEGKTTLFCYFPLVEIR